ncbi:MAG: flavin monoamine oxidase family protein [Steroidobacteraceae bacterium]
MRRCDVLILGAGAAGLAAGRQLAAAGKRVVIVEARDRIGGRILTTQQALASGAAPIPIELGAEFIHGLPRSIWDLVGEAQLATYELDGVPWCFDEGLLRPCGDEHREPFEVLAQMPQWLERQPPGTDATFAEYLDRAGIEKSHAEQAAAFVEGFNAADRNIIGVAALVRQQRAENDIQADRIFHIRAGYSALAQFLADRFRQAGGTLLLDRPVRTIRWARGAVCLSGLDRGNQAFELQASQAVITLPLGILKAGAVRFFPEPADMEIQAARMAMGPVVRQTLLFDRPFWGLARPASGPGCAPGGIEHLSFLFARQEALPTWWTVQPETTPLITAWAAGPKALALPRALLDEALSTLARIFGLPTAAVKKMLVSWHTHDWQGDEYSRGAYSYAPSGALDASLRMAQPVEQTLYFAGEHTDIEGHWGTVHAALNSGLRAAEQLLGAPPV